MSAFGITPTFTATPPTHLAPFALWTAFPSADYYGASVPVRLAPRRASRVPSTVDVQDGLGALFVSLFRPLETAQLPWSAQNLTQEMSGLQREQPAFIRRCRPDPITVRTLGFRQSSFHPAIRASPNLPLGGFMASRLSRHATFPYGFRFQVGLAAQGHCTRRPVQKL